MVLGLPASPSPACTTPKPWQQIEGDRSPSVPSHCLCQPVPLPRTPKARRCRGAAGGQKGRERLCWRLLPCIIQGTRIIAGAPALLILQRQEQDLGCGEGWAQGGGAPETIAGPVSPGLCHHGGAPVRQEGTPGILSLLWSHLSILAGGALPQTPTARYPAGSLLVKLGALGSQNGPPASTAHSVSPLAAWRQLQDPTLHSPYPKSPSPAPHSTVPHMPPSHCPIPRRGVIP